MAFTYDLTATEIIQKLGCTEPLGAAALEQVEREKGVKLPSLLFRFLSYAANCPLFSTSDLWVDPSRLHTQYDFIEEWIEDDREYFEGLDPDEGEAESEFYPYFRLPRAEWNTLAEDYLHIGSDFGAGIVTFALHLSDLSKNDPTVYANFEDDSLTSWSVWDDTLSDFLMRSVCDVLCCDEYDTAKRVLTKEGWNVRNLSFEEFSSLPIDSSAMLRWRSGYGVDPVCGCAYEEAENRFIFAKVDRGDPQRTVIMEYRK